MLLQRGEIGLRIATEAELTSTALMAVVEGLTQRTPSSDIGEPQVRGREGKALTGPGGHHAHRATHDQGGRRPLTSGDPSFHMACRAKVLLKIIVGTRQVFNLVAAEQSLPVALGDFAEVYYRRSEPAQHVLLLCHGLEQVLILLLEGLHITLLGVGEQVSGLVEPRIRLPDGRPELLCHCQSSLHKPLQSAEFVGKPLFSATRLIESLMACSRS